MTLQMPDSIYPDQLPAGYPAYLGYPDGKWPTIRGSDSSKGNPLPPLAKIFPAARILSLTVTGVTLDADGIDIEPGNPNAAGGADWAARKLAQDPGSRPVMYASKNGDTGYGMPWVLAELAGRGIARDRVRLLSAHYGIGVHICSPGECGATFTADGTQWTDAYPSVNGAKIDMSELADGFFGPPPALSWQEKAMQALPLVRYGDTGPQVRTVQGLCNARTGTTLKIDGVFGPLTYGMVKAVQQHARISDDGIVGPQTWPVLMGVA